MMSGSCVGLVFVSESSVKGVLVSSLRCGDKWTERICVQTNPVLARRQDLSEELVNPFNKKHGFKQARPPLFKQPAPILLYMDRKLIRSMYLAKLLGSISNCRNLVLGHTTCD